MGHLCPSPPPLTDVARLQVALLGSGSSLRPANRTASLEVCAGMTQLELSKEYSCGERKTLDGPRVNFLWLKEAERYLYSEDVFLTYFH